VHKDRQCRCDWRTIDQPASADAIARYAWRAQRPRTAPGRRARA